MRNSLEQHNLKKNCSREIIYNEWDETNKICGRDIGLPKLTKGKDFLPYPKLGY